MTIEESLNRCEMKDYEGIMVSVSELKRGVKYISNFKRVKEKVEGMIKELENKTLNRKMNHTEYTIYSYLKDILDTFNDDVK